MRIPDMLKSIVTPLYIDFEGSPASIGTAFYVALTEREQTFLYLVTCRHTIAPYLAAGLPLLTHPPAGSSRPASRITLRGEWAYPPEPGIDLAVISVGWIQEPRPFEAPALLIESPHVRQNPYRPGNHLVRWGDTVMAIGVLPSFEESSRLTSLARFGRVSALPADPLPGPYGPAPAILIDCPPLPGGCGGPVFASFEFSDRQTLFPLGVMAGEFTLTGQPPGSGLLRIVPFDFVVQTLFGEQISAQRDDIRRMREPGSQVQSGGPIPTRNEI